MKSVVIHISIYLVANQPAKLHTLVRGLKFQKEYSIYATNKKRC